VPVKAQESVVAPDLPYGRWARETTSMRKLGWRFLVRPEMLLLIGALQANLPYLLWYLGYPISREGRFDITYQPLHLWILAYLAFYLGCLHVSSCLCRKSRGSGSLTVFRVTPGTYWTCMIVVIVLVLVQVFLACRLYGALPILAFASGYDIGEVNKAQEASGFGQLGLLRLTNSALGALIVAGFVSNIRSNRSNRRVLWVAIGVTAFASLFAGKTQGLFLFGCMLFTGVALSGVNPLCAFSSPKNSSSQNSRRRTILVLSVLCFLLMLFHAGIHYIRRPGNREFGIAYAFEGVVSYMSWPLMNMEKQVQVSGFSGGSSEWRGLLDGLLPFKWRSDFRDAQVLPKRPKVVRTSPSGFLSQPHWCLGLGWMLVFMFGVGVTCQYLYVQSARSLFCLLVYSLAAWTLVAAHSYNHFLTLMFLPAPAVAFFPLAKLIGSTRLVGVLRTCAYRARYAA